MIVEVKVRQSIEVEVSVEDIVYAINEMPIHRKLNEVAGFINRIDTEDLSLLKPEHVEMIKGWLKRQTERFEAI